MKKYRKLMASFVSGAALLACSVALLTIPVNARAQSNSLTNGLVAYWPMDIVTNGTTPDLVHGYDLILNNVLPSNFIPSTRNGGHIGTMSTISAGNAVSFTNSQGGFLYYLANPGDLLPINLQSNYTINFWINLNGSNQSDTRIFAEDDFNGSANPIWSVGTGGGGGSAEDANLHCMKRQQSITINGNTQGPDKFETQSEAYTSLNPCDGNWHMITITKQFTNDTVTDNAATGARQAGSNCMNFEVYVDTVRDPGNSGSLTYATQLDAFGQQAVMTPENWTNQNHTNLEWTWLINATSFGGLSRTLTGGLFITGQVDDAAMWKRPLTQAEIIGLFQNGLSPTAMPVTAQILSFAADAHQVLYGDTVGLQWNTPENSPPTTLTISPGVGDVLPLTVNGAGSVTVTITSNVTYALVASRLGTSVTSTVAITVSKQPVAANWHLVENFDALPTNEGPGITAVNWEDFHPIEPALDLLNVSSLSNTNQAITLANQVCGNAHFAGGTPIGDAAANELNGLTIQTNATNTLFFRVYVQGPDLDPDEDDFSFFLGIKDTNLEPAVVVLDGFNAGPRINIQRTFGGTGGIVDVLANDGVSSYDVIENGVTNSSSTHRLSTAVPAGLTPGVVYDFWLDIFDKPFGSSTNANGTTNTSGTLYSVYYKPLGAATRTQMFTNLLSDRSPFGATPAPPAALGQIFLALDSEAQNPNIVLTGTNTIVVDDIYLSKTNLNATIPVAPGVFPDLVVPISITVHEPVYLASDPANGNNPSVTLNWSSIPGAIYTVYKSSSLTTAAPWQLLVTELPSGGPTTSYRDTPNLGPAAFYKITSP